MDRKAEEMSKNIGVNGKLLVSSLKTRFKDAFGVEIRVYNGVKFAAEDATLASVRVEGKGGGKEFSVHGNTKVGNVEKAFLENVGVRIQIENADGGLADNEVTVGSLRRD